MDSHCWFLIEKPVCCRSVSIAKCRQWKQKERPCSKSCAMYTNAAKSIVGTTFLFFTSSFLPNACTKTKDPKPIPKIKPKITWGIRWYKQTKSRISSRTSVWVFPRRDIKLVPWPKVWRAASFNWRNPGMSLGASFSERNWGDGYRMGPPRELAL